MSHTLPVFPWDTLVDAAATARSHPGGIVDLSRYIHPRVEPEVCFVTRRAIDAPLTSLEAADYLEAVAPAMEIIDSRYRDFRFTYTDVVADNTSAAGYVIGRWLPLQNVEDRSVRMEVGGETVVGSTSAILGDPVRALHALLDIARRRRIPLRAGQVILAGAATAAVRLDEGVAQIGRASCRERVSSPV